MATGNTYEVLYAKRVEKQLRAIPTPSRERVLDTIEALANDPRPYGYRKLSGLQTGLSVLYRVQQGDYRVIYTIRDQQLLVLVLKVGDRQDIYDRLEAIQALAERELAQRDPP